MSFNTTRSGAPRAPPQVRGFVHWLRFPTYMEETQGGYRIALQDVRYSRTRNAIGTATVELDEELRPR